MIIWIDIETIPSGDLPTTEEMISYAPGNMKKEETIRAWADNAENKMAIHKKKSLSWLEAQVICIAYAVDDGPLNIVFSTDEQNVISMFAEKIQAIEPVVGKQSAFIFAGHNIREFDLPILYLRALKYGNVVLQRALPSEAKSGRIIDTIELFSLTAWRKLMKMSDLATFFGLPVKTEMSGETVYDEYLAGNYEKIKNYCMEDVGTNRQLYGILTGGM